MITLYDYELSGNCYKLRLFMNMLGVKHETKSVDFYPGREHKSEWFLKSIHSDDCLCSRTTILCCAMRRRSSSISPRATTAAAGGIRATTPRRSAAFPCGCHSADAITATASAARLHDGLFYKIDIDAARAGAHRLLRILDEIYGSSNRKGRIS